jgi:hypothetical protein
MPDSGSILSFFLRLDRRNFVGRESNTRKYRFRYYLLNDSTAQEIVIPRGGTYKYRLQMNEAWWDAMIQKHLDSIQKVEIVTLAKTTVIADKSAMLKYLKKHRHRKGIRKHQEICIAIKE